jgi:hypothetical protein
MLDGSSQVVEAGQIECTENDLRTIDRNLKRIAKRRRELDREEAEWLLKAERARVHTRFGYGSFFEYLERVLGYGPKTAIDRLRVAHTLEAHPALGKAGLAFTALREVARVVDAENVDEWIATCRGKTVHEIEELVSGLKKGDRPGSPRGERDHVVRLTLKPQTVALLREVQRELADEAGGAVSDDAVVNALCRAYLDGGDIGARKTPTYQISISTCDECGRSHQDGGGVTVEVSRGGP